MAEKQSTAFKVIKGGKRPGAGRKKGVPNKRTQEVQAAVEASGLSPLDYMLGVMRNTAAEPRERLNAAVAAAPYVHAKLSAVEVTGANGGAIQTDNRWVVEFVRPSAKADPA